MAMPTTEELNTQYQEYRKAQIEEIRALDISYQEKANLETTLTVRKDVTDF